MRRGWLFLGGVGSGKTFNSAELIAEEFRQGGPCLVACVKPDEFERVYGIARKAGHASRVVRITPDGEYRMNLVDSLLDPHGSAMTVAQLLAKIGEVGKKGTASGAEKFWVVQAERCMAASIVLNRAICGHCSVTDMHATIMSAPRELEELKKPEWRPECVRDEKGEPLYRGRCAELVVAGHRRGLHATDRAWRNALDYLVFELPGAGEKVKGSVTSEVNNTLGRFIDDPWARSLSTTTTLHPKAIEEHNLIGILDAPVMSGMMPSRMWQFAWIMEAQRWVMRRPFKRGMRNFTIIRDEIGLILNGNWDQEVAIVGRGQGLAHIDIAQDMDTLLAALNGEASKREVQSFANNHINKCIFSTDSLDTAKWFSALIGEHEVAKPSGGASRANPDGSFDEAMGCGSVGWQLHWEPVVRPEEIVRMPVAVAILVSNGRARFVDFRRTPSWRFW